MLAISEWVENRFHRAPMAAWISLLYPLFAVSLVCCVLECSMFAEDIAPRAAGREPLPGLVPAPGPLPGIGRWQLAYKVPRGRIQAVAWSPDGRKLAYSDMSYVRICDAQTFDTERILVGHSNRVSSIDWNRSNNRIASASYDGTVRIWSADGVPEKVLKGHTREVNGVAWSKSGNRLASVGNDGTLRIWSADGSALQVIQASRRPVNCIAWRPDGTRLISGDDSNQVKLWNVDGTLRRVCEGHLAGVTLVAWGPGGKRFGSATAGFHNEDGRNISDVRLWDADGTPTGSLVRDSRVFGLQWNPDGSFLTITNHRGQLQFIRPNGKLKSHQKIAQIGGEISEPRLAWSPNGKEIAIAGTGNLVVVNPEDVTQVRLSKRVPYALFRNVAFPAIARNRDRAIVGPEGREPAFGLWNLTTATVTDLPRDLDVQRLNNQSFSPSGNRIAYAREQTRLATWNPETGSVKVVTQSDHPIVDVVWGSFEEEIAYSDDEGTIRVVKTDGRKIFEWRPKHPPQAVAPGNGPLVFIGGQRAACFHWRGRALVVGEGSAIETRRLDGSTTTSFEFGSRFQRSWLTRDLQHALGLFEDNHKRFLKMCGAGKEATGKLADWPDDIACFDCSADLTRFVMGRANGEFNLWRLDDPTRAPEEEAAHTFGGVTAVVFSPNGQRFATGGWDSLVKIWKVDGSLERTLYENTLPVGKLWWSGDGKQLLAVAMNGTFFQWTAEQGRLESRILLNENGKPIRIGRDGHADSSEAQTIGDELYALLEKADGSVEIVGYSEFLKRTGRAAQESTDSRHN